MISIIIPTLNEAKNIVLLIERINQILMHKEQFEIVLVDDNSADQTTKIAESLRYSHIRVFCRSTPEGLASAVLFGISKAKGEIIVGMDADFNHPPELLPRLIDSLRQVDLVIASRFVRGGGMENKIRYYLTFLFNWLLKRFFNFPTMDNMSGYYAIKRAKLEELPLRGIYQGYGEYHLRLVWEARKQGLTIAEIPVYYPERKYGQSKSRLGKMFLVYLLTAIKLRYNHQSD